MRKHIKKWMVFVLLIFLFCMNCLSVCAASYNGVSYTTDFRQWKQGAAAWGSRKLGDLCTMSNSGCLITSIAIQMARSGAENPETFNPGVLRDRLENGGYISHNSGSVAADGNLMSYGMFTQSNSPAFYYAGNSNFHPTPLSQICSTLRDKINSGYYAVVQVNYGGHWVAVESCDGNDAVINDPAGNSGKTRLSQYNGGIESAVYFKGNGSGPSSNPGLSTDTPYNPEGCLDSVTGGNGTITIRGWAFDRNSLGEALSIHVYVGGPYNGSPAWGTDAVKANKLRSDVNNVYSGVGEYHGFEETLQVPVSGQYDVYVYAINVGGKVGTDYNTLLGTRTVTICGEGTHVWNGGVVTKQPGCTESGIKTFTCTRCNATKTEGMPAFGHTGGTEIKNKRNVTCTAEGYTGDVYCKTCNKILEKGQVIPASGHKWNVEIDKDEEVKIYTCTLCETTRTEPYLVSGEDDNQKESDNSTVQTLKPGEIFRDKTSAGVYKVTKDGKNVVYMKPFSTKKTVVKIPGTVKVKGITYKVTAISASAFKNNKKVKTISIGKNVTTIGTGAFASCSRLKSIAFGNKVTSIGTKAFYKCTALTKITIPSGVKTIGKQAFYGCKNVRNIVVKSKNLTSGNTGSNAFKGLYSRVKVAVPSKKAKAYIRLFKSKGISSRAGYKKY